MRLLPALALAALLAGCGRGGDDPEPAPSVPSPAQAAASADAPRPAEPRPVHLTADGYGPLRVGMTKAEVVTALGADSDPDAVGGPDPAACDQFRPARAPGGLLVMIEDGRLSRISLIPGSTVTTEQGLGPGASEARVREAYGDRLVVEPHKYSAPPASYLLVWTVPGKRGVVFETDERRTVTNVHAGGPSIRYVEGCL